MNHTDYEVGATFEYYAINQIGAHFPVEVVSKDPRWVTVRSVRGGYKMCIDYFTMNTKYGKPVDKVGV